MILNNGLRAIGLMSGSSLDGLDIVCASFHQFDNAWKYDLEATACIALPKSLLEKIQAFNTLSLFEICELDIAFAKFSGAAVNQFIKENNLSDINLICAHGHTLLHAPDKHFSLQIGSGAHIAAICGIKTIANLRMNDMAKGGQGAPIVPIGEKYLFPDCKAFLNLGGIANISLHQPNKIKAFDVCACNQVLNYFSMKKGKEFDNKGEMARSGKLNTDLLEELNLLPYYQLPQPKSLDNAYSKHYIIPLIEKYQLKAEDNLRTYCEHIALQIANVFPENTASIMISGGGKRNSFLAALVLDKTKTSLHEVDDAIIDYKEALIMAFYGVLRLLEIDNNLAEISGADKNSCGGCIYLP